MSRPKTPPATSAPLVPSQRAVPERLLSREEFQGLAEVPPEAEWFANITNPNTRRAYKNDVRDFMRFL